MNPAALRNLTWQEVKTHLTADMLRVRAAWRDHGPGTTREVARRSGISILTLRPRTTDLYHLGLVDCIGRAGTSGIYQFRTAAQARAAQAWRTERRPQTQEPRATIGTTVLPRHSPMGEGGPQFTSHAQMVAFAAGIMGREAARKRRRVEPRAETQLELLSA